MNLLSERKKYTGWSVGVEERILLVPPYLDIFIHVRSVVQGHELRGCFQFSFVFVTGHVDHS